MNLLCPNCQKMLTVPEEFAGQLMKCPLCNGAFTVPGLPGTTPQHVAEPEPNIYSMRPEPSSPPPSHFAPPPSEPAGDAARRIQLATDDSGSLTEAAPLPEKTPQMMENYQRTLSVSLSPRVLPWIAPECLLLVFLLQFFSWVGIYPGGVPSVTQNAWQAAFGLYTEDGNLKSPAVRDDKYKPGVSVLTLFYLLLFFPALIITLASVAIDWVPFAKLPPVVKSILPWRWSIVAAVNLIPFFFLALQLLLGFSLDSRYSEWVQTRVKTESKEPKSTPQELAEQSQRGTMLRDDYHTVWLRLVVLLHLAAIASSVLMLWIDRRGTKHPLPKLELRW